MATKPLPKPISLNGLRFSDRRGKFIVSEDHFLTFRDMSELELFISTRRKFWEETLKIEELTIMPFKTETLEEIAVYKIMKLVAKELGIPIDEVLAKNSKREVVEVRRITIKLCSERNMKVTVIARAMGMGHDLVIYHQNQFKRFCEVEKGYEEKYLEIENSVFSTLFGNFLEDGSGEIKLINNDK